MAAKGFHAPQAGKISLRWNQERSDENISVYYTEPFHHRWLLAATAAANTKTL